jgi:hypothetical protein
MCVVHEPAKIYLDASFTTPTQPRYSKNEPIMEGQKPKRGTAAIMATT